MSQVAEFEGRDDVTPNHNGGLVFKMSPWDRLDQFLILGSESNTLYVTNVELTKRNAQNAIQLIRTEPQRVIDRVVEISDQGRAPKNDYALFVLALAASDPNVKTRKAALAALPKVARTGTHLFQFVSFVREYRGFGSSLRKALSNWYNSRTPDSLAYQVVKYQSRYGWSNRDVLRLTHTTPATKQHDAVFRWVVNGIDGVKASTYKRGKGDSPVVIARQDATAELPVLIQAFEEAKTASEARIIELIREHNLPREAIPTEMLTKASVWEALFDKMPMTAMIRNIATITRVGLVSSGSQAQKELCERLNDLDNLRRARIHPLDILAAYTTYGSGKSARGNSSWKPVREVVESLDDAFYLSFKTVEPTGKPTLLALDVSSSMESFEIAGLKGLTPRLASAAMALVTLAVEDQVEVVGFTTGGWSNPRQTGWKSSVKKLNIRKGMRIEQVLQEVSRQPFAGTDCSLPMIWAASENREIDNFIVYTDSETYHAFKTPTAALNDYRAKSGRFAKLAVVGMVSNGFSIADPKDPGMMDVVGFDSAAPSIMSDFFRR